MKAPKRKEWTLFYCTKEIDEALRECDNKRAEAKTQEWLKTHPAR